LIPVVVGKVIVTTRNVIAARVVECNFRRKAKVKKQISSALFRQK